MNENRIGSATIADYECGYCRDSGVQSGYAELDGVKIIVNRVCVYCDAAKRAYKEAEKDVDDGVVYDF